MPHTNPTSPIRSGFDYQNLWSLRLCGEWLEDPGRYKWIQFETCPDEDNPNRFYLDDIVCLDSEDFLFFYQAKHRQDPTNRWTWEDLLTTERPNGTSIAKKWGGSLLPRIDKCKSAYFVTDGLPAGEIAEYLSGETLDIQKIKKEDTALYGSLVKEIGIEAQIDRIFQRLHFRFHEESLTELESNIRQYFYEKLSATESGVTNLYLEITKECRKRYPRRLDIETLRRWCEFDVPRPLEEQFEIPADFEFFDKNTHQSILSDLQKPAGGIRVIFGKPGVGKSVYLSKLDEELRARDIISIKHHYHISPEDSNPQERLNAERVIEAVKSQLKAFREELGDLANRDSKQVGIDTFVTFIATRLSQKGKTVVIIVDGLDHVLRYGEKEELETLLKAICLPQPGLWIIIGMQEIAQSYLPQIVLDRCPKDQWTEIKGLSRDAVSHLIRANKTGLHLPDGVEALDALAERLFAVTSGNPLHLRYSLHQLKNLFGIGLVTEYSCDDLIPYQGGIEKYYDSLWKQISDNARTLLLTIASVNFHFTEKQLIECVSLSVTNPAEITKAFLQISHLISRSLRGQISVYHNSFDVFLKNRTEMEQQRIVIKTNVRNWLEQSDYDYLKWAEMRIISHELGDSNPLLAIDRLWLIDSICYPCNPDQISNQMKLAAQVACQKGDLARGLQISYLHTYYLNSKEFMEEAPELIWKETFHKNPNIFDYIDFESLPTNTLPELAEIADARGESVLLQEITKVLIERQAGQEYRRNALPPLTVALLKTLPLDRGHELDRIYKYILQFRDLNTTDSLFGIYSQKLLRLSQTDKLIALLKLDLSESERDAILVECAQYGLANNTKDISMYLSGKIELPLLCLLYQLLKNKVIDQRVSLPSYAQFSSTIQEHDPDARKEWQKFFHFNFLISLLYGLIDKEKDIKQWITDAPELWSAKATACLFTAGIKIASGIRRSRIAYGDLFDSLSNLQVLKWPEDRSSLNFQSALRDALSDIVRDIILIKKYLGDDCTIDLAAYAAIIAKPSFFSKDDITSIVLEENGPLFSQELYEKLRNDIMADMSTMVNSFPDRSTTYCRTSKLARLYGDRNYAWRLLAKATDNVLGYGYHKDVYLFEVLEAIELCAHSAIDRDKIDDWIVRVVPLVSNVAEYTDGDETNHLPVTLAELLAQQDPGLLRKYHWWTADQEEFYRADELFRSLLKSLSFSSDEEIALACSALEKGALSLLKTIAQQNSGAQLAVSNIESYLGEINYPEEKQDHYQGSEKPRTDYSIINPEHLVEHLSITFQNRWEWNDYLKGWFDYWPEKLAKETVSQVFEEIIEKFGIHAISGEILDKLYPIVYEVNTAAAFDMLCRAQMSDYGWQRYWTDKKKAERRWEFVKEKYPMRYMEFFYKSTEFHVPLGRGIEFFLLFGDIERAVAIAEASVQFAESLMGDLSLSVPKWLKQNNEITVLDLLFQRLLWPSPLVRERTSTGLADLLSSSEQRTAIFKELLHWIRLQKMETVVAIGLLPIIKAFHISETPQRLAYMKIEDIASSILVNSKVIEKLMDEISALMGVTKAELPTFSEIDLFSDTYSPGTFFSKYVRTFLAPIYMHRAEKIEKDSRRQFVKQWAFTADQIIEDCGIRLDTNQAYYYGRSEHDEFIHGFSSKISEAYRSAFLRVLQLFYQNGDIHEEFYLEYAYATLPIELSRWKILPTRSPEWWPRLAHGNVDDVDKKDSIMSIALQQPIEDLIENQKDTPLLAAEGAIQAAEGWAKADPFHSFMLVSFGYEIVGPELPTAEQVAQAISYAPGLARIPSMTKRPFSFLEDKKNHLPIKDKPVEIKDIVIHPIAAREQDLCIALWQYFRDQYPPFNINPSLEQGLRIKVGKTYWELQDKDGKSVGVHSDWLEGLKERYNRDMPVPHGQYLMADKAFIDKWLKDKHLRIGYVLKTTYRSRRYSYDEVKRYEEFRLINVSSIII